VSGTALGLVLAASLLHAAWNLMLHDTADRMAAAAVAAVVGAVVLLPSTLAVPPAGVWPLVLASGTAEAIYFIFLTAAYRRGELSFTYPVARGIAPFLITLGSAAVLGQALSPGRVLGSLALGIGLAVISHAGLRRGRSPAVAFAVLTGLSIATYSVIDARAVHTAGAVGYLGAVTAVEAVILLAATRLDWRRLWAAARPGAGIGVGTISAYLLVLLAYQRAPASPVATLRELSILFGMLLARERPGRRVWLGGVLCVLGAVLVVL
jgi:drug/metabolite transporter (DMT)-like permease